MGVGRSQWPAGASVPGGPGTVGPLGEGRQRDSWAEEGPTGATCGGGEERRAASGTPVAGRNAARRSAESPPSEGGRELQERACDGVWGNG